MNRFFLLVAVIVTPTIAQDTPPRRLTPTSVTLNVALGTISGVRELRDGRLLVSDAKNAAVYLVDPAKGQIAPIGTAGGGDLQYAQPGGFYGGAADSTLLLDRGLAKALVIAPNGSIVVSRSIKRRGVTSSSSDDIDHQRLDARGLAYFALRGASAPPSQRNAPRDSVALVRFDAARQHYDTVTLLRAQESRTVQASENMQITQTVEGAPSDEWGVAPDGRVAVVRGAPYRVDWIDTKGQVVRGPVYTVPAISFTHAEKDSLIARSRTSAPSVGLVGGPTTNGVDGGHYFAETKAPFAPNDVTVSPRAEVWVARTQPFGSAISIYDVFDAHGERIDRVAFGRPARIIGFGNGTVYTVSYDRNGRPTLDRYKL